MSSMDLHYFEPRLHRPPGGSFEFPDNLRDSVQCQRCRFRVTLTKRDRTWCKRFPGSLSEQFPAIPGFRHACLSPSMRQLDTDLTALRPNKLDDSLQPVQMLVLPNAEIGRTDPPFRRNSRRFRKDQSGSANRPASQMHQVPVIRHPIPRTILTHRRNHNPVVERNIPYPKRGEQLTHDKMLLRS